MANRRRTVRRRRRRTERKSMTSWEMEFSKKVVVLCVLLHVAAFLYSAVAMWYFADTSTLPTIISESSEVLRSCVFGYMVKAGIENWQKIRNSSNTVQETEEENEQEVSG